MQAQNNVEMYYVINIQAQYNVTRVFLASFQPHHQLCL